VILDICKTSANATSIVEYCRSTIPFLFSSQLLTITLDAAQI